MTLNVDLADLAAASVLTPHNNGTEPHDPAPNDPAPPAAADAPNGTRPEHFTDLGNSYRLARVHGRDLRHVAGWGWLAWDSRRWVRDEKPPMQRAKAVALSFYSLAQEAEANVQGHIEAARAAAAAGDVRAEAIAQDHVKQLQSLANAALKWGRASQARGRLDAMVALAASEPTITATPAQFDADPWLLNCLNGTLDLRSGTLRPHTRADLLTAVAPVAYDPAALCPTWDAFLDRVMTGDADMIGFLQRLVGYSLTGSTREQALFFLYGQGANGKSVFLTTILALLGPDYAKQAAPDVLIETRNEQHPTQIADLASARFVASIEVGDGKRLAENLVKQMTGGDRVKARFMRADFFEFDPQFKIFLAANHRPVVRGTDYAIWRRIKLIPFTVTIPEPEQDKALTSKLLLELPGILAWAVRGCLDWQHDGLRYPQAVNVATTAYRADSDLLAPFLDESCTINDSLSAQAGPLFLAYQAWADRNGVQPRERLTSVTFARQLQERGFTKVKVGRRLQYEGLGLHQAPEKAEN